MKNAYIRYLNFVEALKNLPTLPSLDHEEQAILNKILIAHSKHQHFTVVDLSLNAPDMSQSTALRRIKSLHNKGMLISKPSKLDRRVRTMHLTSLAEEYFDKMGNIIQASV